MIMQVLLVENNPKPYVNICTLKPYKVIHNTFLFKPPHLLNMLVETCSELVQKKNQVNGLFMEVVLSKWDQLKMSVSSM